MAIELSRRQLLRAASALGVGLLLPGCGDESSGPSAGLRVPGSRPDPSLPEGVDTLPEVEHIIILMMENHSFDNYFGALDPSVGLPRQNGRLRATNPDAEGNRIHAFRMPSTCQLEEGPSQSWNASQLSFNGGRNDGFVRASGPVAMGYWTGEDLPFYYGLARTFPLASRWFGSTLAQTYPNRFFLMAGTAAGLIATSSAAFRVVPPNGNIFERLDHFGISWRNYSADLPTVGLFLKYAQQNLAKLSPLSQFYLDAAAGTLPSVTLIDPPYNRGSEENPQDIRVGEQFASDVIRAVMGGPAWSKSLLVWLYDEHGGYYDHVPPPAAIPPDDIPPDLGPGDVPGAYDRYGFRVPAVVVSPYARRHYTSRVVRDHTAILKLIERKWNLGALTFRDANADDLFDCLDFDQPAFLDPPELPPPALAASASPPCTPGDPGGPIPPPEAVTPGDGGDRAARHIGHFGPRNEASAWRALAEVWSAGQPTDV